MNKVIDKTIETNEVDKKLDTNNMIWGNLINSLKNSKIDVGKLIEDSVGYGIEVGIFKKTDDGKIINGSLESNLTSEKNNIDKKICDKNVLTKRSSSVKSNSSDKTGYSSIKDMKIIDKDLDNSPKSKSELHDNNDLNSGLCLRNRNKSIKPSSPSKEDNKKHKIKIRKQKAKPITVCAYCLGDEYKNRRTNSKEDMISCWDCGTCAHPTCLKWPKKLLDRVRNIRWQCLQCKCCSYCGRTSSKDEDMLLCDECDLGFHIQCFDPPLKHIAKGEWICRICRPLSNKVPQEIIFTTYDFEFEPDCQIITAQKSCINMNTSITPPKPKKLRLSSTDISPQTKFCMKSKHIPPKRMTLLQRKRKKLIEKAVERQKEALTDGLSNFFTPSNKRKSRISQVANLSNEVVDVDSRPSSKIEAETEVPVILRKSTTSPKVSNSNLSTKIQNPKCLISNSKKKSLLEKINQKNQKKSQISLIANATKKKIEKLVKNSESRRGGYRKKMIKSNDEGDVKSAEDKTDDTDPPNAKPDYDFQITDMDRTWFNQIQKMVSEILPPSPENIKNQLGRRKSNSPIKIDQNKSFNANFSIDSNFNQRHPPKIQIGRYIIQTWYSAPYPSEYARLKILYLCEYCLKHIKTYDVYKIHMEKCTSYFPPGNEIYRKDGLSIFEVDGHVSKLYCQQLCLLAKLFLDHKTLYYDVEPFLFYVAVIARNNSTHIVGYFSKEKRSSHKYNLSCIMVLPPYQRFNYGRFLIEFSYLLSRREGEFGSPEKPLSVLGSLSYNSYWKSKIIPYLLRGTTRELNLDDFYEEFKRNHEMDDANNSSSRVITIEQISNFTGINPHDVASVIQMMCYRVNLDEEHRITIQFNWELINKECFKYANRKDSWIKLDTECLRWAPFVHPNDSSAAILLSDRSGSNVIAHMHTSPINLTSNKVNENKVDNKHLKIKEKDKTNLKINRKGKKKEFASNVKQDEKEKENDKMKVVYDKQEKIENRNNPLLSNRKMNLLSVRRTKKKITDVKKEINFTSSVKKDIKSLGVNDQCSGQISPEALTRSGRQFKLELIDSEVDSSNRKDSTPISCNKTKNKTTPIKQIVHDISSDSNQEDINIPVTRNRDRRMKISRELGQSKESIIKNLSPKINFRHKSLALPTINMPSLSPSSIPSSPSVSSPKLGKKRTLNDTADNTHDSDTGYSLRKQVKSPVVMNINNNHSSYYNSDMGCNSHNLRDNAHRRYSSSNNSPTNKLGTKPINDEVSVNVDLTKDEDADDDSKDLESSTHKNNYTVPSTVLTKELTVPNLRKLNLYCDKQIPPPNSNIKPKNKIYLRNRISHYQPILEKMNIESSSNDNPPILKPEEDSLIVLSDDSLPEQNLTHKITETCNEEVTSIKLSISHDSLSSNEDGHKETTPPSDLRETQRVVGPDLQSPELIEEENNTEDDCVEINVMKSPSLSSLEYSISLSDAKPTDDAGNEEKEQSFSSNNNGNGLLGPPDLKQSDEFREFFNDNTDCFRLSSQSSSQSNSQNVKNDQTDKISQSQMYKSLSNLDDPTTFTRSNSTLTQSHPSDISLFTSEQTVGPLESESSSDRLCKIDDSSNGDYSTDRDINDDILNDDSNLSPQVKNHCDSSSLRMTNGYLNPSDVTAEINESPITASFPNIVSSTTSNI